jgi:hypothetical protein
MRLLSSWRGGLGGRTVLNHPWLDFFPFPKMRDNLIEAGDDWDDEQLCHDIMVSSWRGGLGGRTVLNSEMASSSIQNSDQPISRRF